MAADVGLRVISRAIRNRSIIPLLELNVDEEWFDGDESLQLWRFAKNHYTRYGECPSVVTVKEALPGYRVLGVKDDIAYLLDRFVLTRRRTQAVALLQDAGGLMASGEAEAAIEFIAQGLTKLQMDTSSIITDRDIVVDTSATVDRYMELRDLEGHMRGLPTGFPTIDKATSGLQRQQLVTIIAPPKVGKSTLALAIARNVHHLSNVDSLFCSFEMSNDEHEARYIAMVGRVSHSDLMTGQLTPKQEKELRAKLLETEGKAHLILTDDHSASSISGLTAKLEKYKPRVAFIDGVYLMRDEVTGEFNTPQALTNITRALKRLAQRFDIPIVVSTQVLGWKMRKGQVTADAIGYSSSFYQDSDVILGLQPEPDDEERRVLKVVSSRNCPKVSVMLDWDWRHTSFTEQSFSLAPQQDSVDDDDDFGDL